MTNDPFLLANDSANEPEPEPTRLCKWIACSSCGLDFLRVEWRERLTAGAAPRCMLCLRRRAGRGGGLTREQAWDALDASEGKRRIEFQALLKGERSPYRDEDPVWDGILRDY
jgi:hypothetical protein